MFYIHPPKGQVALHVLENCVFTRLEYLSLLEANNTDSFSGNFEYLLENSICDSIGHFILRLIAATSSDLWPHWIRRETLFFKQRLNHLSIRQIHKLFRNIIKHLKSHNSNETPISKALMDISTHFLKPPVFNHITEKAHGEGCRKYQCRENSSSSLKVASKSLLSSKLRVKVGAWRRQKDVTFHLYTVPFASVPDLVRKRKIDLRHGHGTVFCSEWKLVLLSLFRTFIAEDKNRLLSSSGHLVSLDPRLSSISQRIHSQTLDKRLSGGNITVKNIDVESKKFPLCMQHLHSVLREKHRLSHHARFYYSLFLKECGMKLEDAIDYWKQEYSKPHTCQSGCTHSWQSNERKFLYSIRHLYGLEGGRKNYKTPNCKMICTELPGLRYEGGCPFKHFDSNTLGMLLRTFMDEPKVQESLNNITLQSPEVACSSFLKIVHKLEDKGPEIYTPVQYYMRVTENK